MMIRKQTRLTTAVILALLTWMTSAAVARPPILVDRWGEPHRPSFFVEDDTEAIVFVFLAESCPVALRMAPSIVEVANEFAERKIVTVGVFPNESSDIMTMAQAALNMELPFPIVLDESQKLSEALEAEVTPEVVVVRVEDGKVLLDEIIYQGKFDDSFTLRGVNPGQSTPFLRNALTSFLRNEPVDVEFTAPVGCRIEPMREVSDTREVTFHEHVEPIMQRRCQSCHRPNEVAPFELVTYDDVADLAETIQDRIVDRLMPPWTATINEHEFGGFRDDMRMTQDEIDTVVAWVRNGAPRGNPENAPTPIHWPHPDEWLIGEPDMVFTMPEPFQVPRTGYLDYQYVRIPTQFNRSQWLRAVEVRPGNRRVVHHVALHLVRSSDRPLTGLAALFELYGSSGESARKIGDFVPGDPDNARDWGANYGLEIPPNHDIIMELHYTPTGRMEEPDSSSIGVIFNDEPPQHAVNTKVFTRMHRFVIPPNEGHHRMEATYYFPDDIAILAMAPHMHYRGKDFRVWLVRNEGTPQESRHEIMAIPTYDFNWQRTYSFEKPIVVRAGDVLHAVAHFDNSRFNPYNPDPDAIVRWGLQTEDEMFNTRVKYVKLAEGQADQLEGQDWQSFFVNHQGN